MTENRVFPMLVGCGRSGTTLIRNVLDTHPDMAITHEAHFIGPMALTRGRYEKPEGFKISAFLDDLYEDSNFVRQGIARVELAGVLENESPRDYASAVRITFRLYAEQQGKAIYGDKTPGSVTHIKNLASLFPEARFIHIVRDGRAVALSYMERPEWGPETAAEAAHHWVSRVRRGRDAGRVLGDQRYLEVRYEDMVDNPAKVTAEMCHFLSVSYHPEMLNFHERGETFISSTKNPGAFKNLAKPISSTLRDWRTEMDPRDQAVFEAIAGNLLTEFGYDGDAPAPSASTRVRLFGSAIQWQIKRAVAFGSRKLRQVGRTRDLGRKV